MARAEVTHVQEGRIFVGIIAPPINEADIVIELHRDQTATRPADVRFMILSREEFRQLLSDWTAFAAGCSDRKGSLSGARRLRELLSPPPSRCASGRQTGGTAAPGRASPEAGVRC
jgi:hypothetical protein